MLALQPFLGTLVVTPKDPHEGPLAMLVGPVLLGVLGIAAAVPTSWTVMALISPAASAIAGHAVDSHLGFEPSFADAALWLSLATWVLAGLLFWRLSAVRTMLRRLQTAIGFSFDTSFDLVLQGLLTLAHNFTRRWQNGSLSFYMRTLAVGAAAALLLPLLLAGGLPGLPVSAAPEPAAWLLAGLALVGILGVLLAPTLLVAILALGVQGTAVALIYLLLGAPDLSFTQFMVETLSVVMFALVMTRLRLGEPAGRSRAAAIRDGVVATLVGGGATLALLGVLDRGFSDRLGTFFLNAALPLAHGRNVVNVILVDFRGLDTLGEISVVLTAGIAILTLIASGRKTPTPAPQKPRRPRRKAVQTPEVAP